MSRILKTTTIMKSYCRCHATPDHHLAGCGAVAIGSGTGSGQTWLHMRRDGGQAVRAVSVRLRVVLEELGGGVQGAK